MISKHGFMCDFLDVAMDGRPENKLYENYFLNYEPQQWKAGGGGGFFKYFDGKGLLYSLLVTDDSRYGIMLSYERWDNNKNRAIKTWYSVGDEHSLNQTVENDDYFKMPLGTYLEPEKAWFAVEDFLSNPVLISKAIQWIDANDVLWPDVVN